MKKIINTIIVILFFCVQYSEAQCTQGNVGQVYTTVGSFGANYILGTKMTVSTGGNLTGLSMYGLASGTGLVQMALYADNAGVPGALLRTSTISNVVAGPVTMSVTPMVITPGNYWLMAIYNVGGAVSNYLNGGSKTVYYTSVPFGNALPANGAGFISYCCQDFNYWMNISCPVLPQIVCPSNIIVSNTSGQCGANVTYPTAAATGTPTPTITYSIPSGSFFPKGTTTVTATATNTEGSSSCTFTVTVNDTQAPDIICPANITVNASSGTCGAVVTYNLPTVLENCSTVVAGSQTFNYTGATETFTVPAGVNSINIQAWGAQGGNLSSSFCTQTGALGGMASGSLSVNPGDVIYVNVGQQGQLTNAINAGYSPNAFNGGGKGWTWNSHYGSASSGGGASDLRIGGNSLNNRVIVAGGAGGGTCNGCIGGTGGGLIGGSGGCSGGGGGTQIAGGTGGISGSFGNGGDANSITTVGWTGGGGGGWYGGASGTSHVAGGGGSSYIGGVTNGSTTPGVRSGNGQIIISWTANIAPIPIQTSGLASGATYPVGTTTNTFTATDAAGNSSTCSFTVTVNDTQAPIISCPANIVVNNTTGQCGANVTFAATASDNCGTANISYSPASGTFFNVGTTTVTATADDGHGNTTTCTFTVTVNDTQAPAITCAPTLIVNNTPGLCTGTANLTAPIVTDNCAIAPQMLSNGSFGTGSTNWDQCGNNVEAYASEVSYGGSDFSNAVAEIDHEPMSLCQNINGFVVGQTYQLTFRASRRIGAPPTVGTQITIDGGALNTTVSRSNGAFNLTPETISFVATQTSHQLRFLPSAGWGGTVGFIIDDISITRQSISNNAPPTFPFGDTTVTWTATDAAGNTTTCNQTVTVNDTEAPTIACPGNITVNNTTNQCGANVSFVATASDNCGTANITYSPASGSFFAVGTTTVTATADDGHGNTASCTFTVTVNDTQPPVINCPANFNVDVDAGQCGAVVNFAATASDNCGTANITYSPASGSFFAVGTTTVTATADDGHGNTASCTFTVTVDLLDWANLQWPPNATICPGGSFTAYGQVYEPNITTVSQQQGAGIEVQFGYSTTNSNPSGWSNWMPALFNQFGGNPANDEYYYDFSLTTPGTYYYTFRYRQYGCAWQYGGFNNGGGYFWDGTNNVSGILTVQSLDWANLQWPPNATICQGSSMTAYGQVYEPGVTPGANAQGAGIEVEFGYSTTNTNPAGWSNWNTATFNQFGGGYANDEYYYNFTPPTSGTYFYTFRYRLNGCLWQYGGYSNPGGYFWDGTNHVNGTLNVSPTTVGGTVSGGTSICPGETSALLTLSGHTGSILRWESSVFPFLSWDPIGNNTTTYTSGPLAETTQFRAVLQSGVCLQENSAATTVIVYLTYPFYADNDDDGYGAGPAVMLCSDDANNAPEGYSVDGTDCDDTLADRHETFPFYVDADGDGYGAEGSTAVQLCAVDGNTPPESNYSVNDEDCNDAVFAINPSVAEIPFDNIDNNCNGTLYDGHPLIVVHVLSPSCGGINHGLNNTINCTEIDLGAGYVIGYRFKVTNLSTGQVDYVDTVQHHFKLTDTDIYAYGTTYSIQVAAIVNGEVQGYNGNTCTLTTTSVATTKVVTSQCGSTLLFMNSTINANAVNSAITYRFRVARADAPTTYYYTGERNLPNFNLTMLTVPVGFLTYATEYKVDVQIKIKLANIIAWSQFGQVCSIFTPAPPTSSVIASQCELVATSYTQVINATPFAGATLYRFLLTHYDEFGDLDYEQYQDSSTPNFTLSMFTGLLPDTTYNVAVAMQLYGTFVPYDKECSITTPMAARMIEAIAFKATVYPNPYTNNFLIEVKTADSALIDIKVYDMVGRLVEQRTVKASDLEKAPIGERYPSGVYNVIVSQGENVQTLRVVRR